MTLYLRPFEKREISTLKSWFPTEEDTLQWGGAGLHYPIKNSQLRNLIRKHHGPQPEHEVWAVLDQDSGVIGHVQIWYSRRLQQAIIGRLAVAPDSRGRGQAYPLICLAVERAFSRDWINRIELRVYDFNTPAISTYKRAGFIHEGSLRQSTPIRDTYWNTEIMSLLRSDFSTFDKRTKDE